MLLPCFHPFSWYVRLVVTNNLMAEVICSQVIDELTEMMNMNKEQVEKTVHESKCDELSAMFNMMMDNKRKDKGRSSIINHRMQKPHVKGSF